MLLYAVLGAALVITLRAMARRWRAADEDDSDVPYGPSAPPPVLAEDAAVSSADAVAGVLWVGVTAYAVFGGADFGAGFWSLVAGRGDRGRRARELIDWAIGPVWEANHVWLIFVLVVLWTGFSDRVRVDLLDALHPAQPGRARHRAARRRASPSTRRRGGSRAGTLAERLFGLSSLLTPFFMGTVVGAVASGRVPVGNAAGDPVTSWLNPLSLVIGALFVATSAYLAAVFLVSDARRAGAPDLERYFTARALAAAVAAGALAVAGIIALHADARYVYDGLTGDALPLVIVSALCGAAVLVLLRRGAHRGARPLAVGAVAAVDLGLGRRPAPVPAAAGAHDRRRRRAERHAHRLLIVFGAAVVLVLPSIAPAVHARAARPDRGGREPAAASDRRLTPA